MDDLTPIQGPIENPNPGPAKNASRSRWGRRALWALASIALLWGLSWALVPPILKHQLQKIAGDALDRKVTVGKIDFKPWTLELELRDLAIAANGDKGGSQPPQLLIKRIYVDAALQSLVRMAPVADAVAVDGVNLKLAHLGDGKYDIDDILARLNRPSGKPASEPLKFALFNLALTNTAVDFFDTTVGKTHELRDLNLSVPFLSNLDSRRDVTTEPKLAFKLNGSRFDSAAQTTPFAQSHKTDASIRLTGVDLKPYLGYVPASVPVRLLAAGLNADIKVAFEQVSRPTVKLSGVVETTAVKLADGRAQDLLAFQSLKVTLDEVRPLEQVAKIALLELSAPTLEVSRDKAGNINLQLEPLATNASASAGATPNTTENVANNSSRTRATANNDAKKEPWKLEIAKVTVRGGSVTWRDDTTAPQATLVLRDVVFDASAIALPVAQPLQFSGTAALAGVAPALVAASGPGAIMTFSGSATDQAATVSATVKEVPLTLAAPYLAQHIEPTLGGTVSTELAVDWKPSELSLAVKLLTLDNLALVQKPVKNVKSAPALASLKKLEIVDSRIELGPQTITVGKLSLDQLKASVERGSDGRWMFERWMKPVAAPQTRQASTAPARDAKEAKAPQAKPWTVGVADVSLNASAFTYLDQTTPKPVSFEVSAIKAQVKSFSTDAKKPFPLSLSARIRAPQGEPGQLDYRGNLGLLPLAAQGKVVATQIPVHAFEPYFGDALNIELLRADVGFKGDMRFVNGAKGPQVKVTGDSVLEEFRANSTVAKLTGTATPSGSGTPAGGSGTAGDLKISEELLSWKALSLRGLDVTVEPGTATTVSVSETALTDFFARVLINETGRINLQDLVKSAAAPEGAQPSNPPNPPNPLDPVINIGPISLVNGKVYFSDRFVKPNYSANLSELTGNLSAFSSVAGQGSPPSAPQMADLELRGRAEGTASLEILGKLNPLAKPLALDIKGKVRDLELAPLSPYSVKYAGYGIERGKLSVDVGYVVLPNGNLSATNNIILNQLTFGDKVEGAPASLPVKLAVALLADRNGVIDINLPISGSLNDPQFRLGPLIFKVIVNLIVKAITSPFSLLASAFGGGGDELSMVAFAPGTAVLGPDARAGLDKVAKALTERPGLKMTVVGSASLEAEREAYKRERLKALLQAEKRRAAVVGGGAPAAPLAPTEAETPALLKEVYKRADMAKPRNLIGIAKDIPPGEMEALLLANIPVTEDAMRELALQRGVAVKEYLADKQLPAERLFLGAAKPGAIDAKWTPRAELNLLTN